MHYLDEGAGPPLVMVHGNPTWSAYYRELVRAFRDEYRVVVPDHIGCGLSDAPGDARYAYRLARRIDDLQRLLDHCGLHENVTLVVHDWGGMIGFGAAVRRPERIARLVVLNTAAFRMPVGKKLPWELAFVRRAPLLPALLIRGANAFARAAAKRCVVRPMPEDARALLLAPYRSWRARRAVLRFVQDIPIASRDPSYADVLDVERGLARLADKPMLICWGQQDFVFDTDYYNEWRERFPDAEAHLWEDAGHYVLEDAAERVIARMRGFFDRCPLPRPAYSAPPAGETDS
ncbi:MAG: alpha/beta fold hydrolase [Planctomycetota bacterium]|nr:MAG: alpha/beta fold hydrolase [Planctomycetota bacterium]